MPSIGWSVPFSWAVARGAVLPPTMQLRMTHFALNSYLYHFGLAPSPDCAHCLVLETMPHYLLACPAYHLQHLCLIQQLGTACLSLCLLLSVKSQPKPLLDFVRKTARFPCYAL
ncbi:hypothetical protein B0H13DRAFT_2369550 [Mycena leptocephala]|nr:hypothetical protein B0H13DRAFT_2369550 [Mycena leptocephala]